MWIGIKSQMVQKGYSKADVRMDACLNLCKKGYAGLLYGRLDFSIA